MPRPGAAARPVATTASPESHSPARPWGARRAASGTCPGHCPLPIEREVGIFDHLHRDPQRGSGDCAWPDGPANQNDAPSLDGELDVDHVGVGDLQRRAAISSSCHTAGHRSAYHHEGEGVVVAGHHVVTGRIDEEVAHEDPFPRGWVPGERDAGAGIALPGRRTPSSARWPPCPDRRSIASTVRNRSARSLVQLSNTFLTASSTRSALWPTSSSVSSMPGIDTGAPDRTLTCNGVAGSPRRMPLRSSRARSASRIAVSSSSVQPSAR